MVRMEVDQSMSCKSVTTDLESNSSPRNNSYVVKQQDYDSPHNRMTTSHTDCNGKSKNFYADIVADTSKSQLTRNGINAIDQEIYSIYNRDNFKIKKNILTYECQFIFPGEIFRDVYHGKDILQSGLISRVDCDEFGMQINDININDVYVRTGQFVSYIKTHLYDINQLVEKKFTETNTFTKTFKLGFRLKPIQADKRAICYIKLVESLELLKMVLQGIHVHHTMNKCSSVPRLTSSPTNVSADLCISPPSVAALPFNTVTLKQAYNVTSTTYYASENSSWDREQMFHTPMNRFIPYDSFGYTVNNNTLTLNSHNTMTMADAVSIEGKLVR